MMSSDSSPRRSGSLLVELYLVDGFDRQTGAQIAKVVEAA